MIVLFKISKGNDLGGGLYFACPCVFGFPSRMCIYWFSSSPIREKTAASVYYFLNHKMEALAFRYEVWEERWSALYLTKHSEQRGNFYCNDCFPSLQNADQRWEKEYDTSFWECNLLLFGADRQAWLLMVFCKTQNAVSDKTEMQDTKAMASTDLASDLEKSPVM